MSDFISRQAAIEAVEHITSSMSVCVNTDECHGMKRMQRQAVIELANLPSAQPERLTDDDFETIRIHLNAYKEKLCNQGRWKEAVKYQNIIDRFMAFASAQPERKWIPVSEKLPEVGRSVLFSRRSMGTREGCLQADGKWWQYRWNEMLNADQVTAWKSPPEPYRAERRTDEDR